MTHPSWLSSSIELESLRKFVRQDLLPGAKERDDREEFPLKLIERFHELGWLQCFISRDLGGSGLNTMDLMWIARELSYGSRGFATSVAGNMLSLVPILDFGKKALSDSVAKSALARPELSCFCFTEPEAGSDILSITTTARKVSGGYLIKGRKCFITNANYASHFVVMAKIAGEDHPRKSISAFYMPRSSQGLSVGKPLSKLGHRESNTTDVFFENVFVPDEHLLGEEGGGLTVAVKSLRRSRSWFAAAAVGLCDRARDLSIEFLQAREHYGKPLLQQPAIRNQLAQLETESRAAWYMACAAAEAWDKGDQQLQHSSMAKLFACQVVTKYLSAAIELFGGYGYTREFEIERLYRDAKLFEILEGPTFVQQTIIAKEILPPSSVEFRSSKKAA